MFVLLWTASTCVELGVGMNTEGIEVRSVGNTLTLHETALIESFNLQAAIEYQHKHCLFRLTSDNTVAHLNIC